MAAYKPIRFVTQYIKFTITIVAILIIQHIHTIWTKKSRGMPQAARRNAAPKAMPLPFVDSSQPFLIHEINAHEFNHFDLVEKSYWTPQLKHYWRLNIDADSTPAINSASISMDYDPKYTGAPNRGAYIRKLFDLSPSQSALFQINGRFSQEAIWYEQHQIHVALLHQLDSHIFLNKAPDFHVNQLENLF